MSEDKEYCVDGYRFTDKSDYEYALKEYENLNTLKEKINVNDLNNLKGVYYKLIEKRYLKTPVGINFLHELKNYIEENDLSDEALPDVPVPQLGRKNRINVADADIVKLKEENKKLNNIKKGLITAVVALVAIVVGMFFIAATNDNAKYLNYENKVLDKYSKWEEELKLKEKELKDLEERLSEEKQQ